ncbi:MAG: glycosyltransferase family 87 protein [Candidatus Sigynarchaeota archaeon]
MVVIAVLEALDAVYFPESRFLFPGKYDFEYQYQYTYGFLTGNRVPAILPGGSKVYAYYPPGVAIIYLMLISINYGMNSLLYRWYILIFEAGVYYLIWKIANIPSLQISRSYREKGVIYAFFSVSFLSAIDFFGKYDIIMLFIVLLGVYFYLQERYFISGALIVFAGFIKIYPFVWIAGILMFHIKNAILSAFNLAKKDPSKKGILPNVIRYIFVKQRQLVKFLLGVVIFGGVILLISIIFEGTRLFELLFSFKFQIAEGAYAIYMMNFWFYLTYTRIPFINLVPYCLLLVSLIYYFIWRLKEIDIAFFIKTTAIVLIFYPAVNSVYINFIIPFICIGLLGSIKKVRVLALLEIAAMWVEQLFNTIFFYTGLLAGELMLSMETFPPAWFVVFRFINLGLFFAILIMLVLPERFERWFPIEIDSRTIVSERPSL